MLRKQGRLKDADDLEASVDPGELPEEAELVWEAFLEICSGRTVSEGQPTSSILNEVYVWSRLYSVELLPWELKALQMLDGVWCTWIMRQYNARLSAARASHK